VRHRARINIYHPGAIFRPFRTRRPGKFRHVIEEAFSHRENYVGDRRPRLTTSRPMAVGANRAKSVEFKITMIITTLTGASSPSAMCRIWATMKATFLWMSSIAAKVIQYLCSGTAMQVKPQVRTTLRLCGYLSWYSPAPRWPERGGQHRRRLGPPVRGWLNR